MEEGDVIEIPSDSDDEINIVTALDHFAEDDEIWEKFEMGDRWPTKDMTDRLGHLPDKPQAWLHDLSPKRLKSFISIFNRFWDRRVRNEKSSRQAVTKGYLSPNTYHSIRLEYWNCMWEKMNFVHNAPEAKIVLHFTRWPLKVQLIYFLTAYNKANLKYLYNFFRTRLRLTHNRAVR
jgi:hypothetical protein